jgi:hypothetical protein
VFAEDSGDGGGAGGNRTLIRSLIACVIAHLDLSKNCVNSSVVNRRE